MLYFAITEKGRCVGCGLLLKFELETDGSLLRKATRDREKEGKRPAKDWTMHPEFSLSDAHLAWSAICHIQMDDSSCISWALGWIVLHYFFVRKKFHFISAGLSSEELECSPSSGGETAQNLTPDWSASDTRRCITEKVLVMRCWKPWLKWASIWTCMTQMGSLSSVPQQETLTDVITIEIFGRYRVLDVSEAQNIGFHGPFG